MLCIGLDPSLTGLAVVAVDHRGIAVFRRRIGSVPAGKTPVDRINRYLSHAAAAVNVIRDAEKMGCLSAIWIEGYAFASANFATTAGEFGGILRLMILQQPGWKLLLTEINPTSLKMFATGKGRCGKGQIAANVRRQWKHLFATDDENDAYVLGRMASVHILGLECTQPQRQVVEVALGLIPSASKLAQERAKANRARKRKAAKQPEPRLF